jgi:hypothetical protein
MRNRWLSVAALAVSVVACSPKLDAKKLEDRISTSLKGDGLPVTRVTCPPAEPVQKGATFQCEVGFEDDTTAALDVLQNGDGNVEWKKNRILLLSDFVKTVEKKTREKDATAAITCPGKPVVIVKKDLALTCSLKAATGSADYVITFTDDDGAWTAKSTNEKDAAPAKQAEPAPAE